jgi:hypothetical protein
MQNKNVSNSNPDENEKVPVYTTLQYFSSPSLLADLTAAVDLAITADSDGVLAIVDYGVGGRVIIADSEAEVD